MKSFARKYWSIKTGTQQRSFIAHPGEHKGAVQLCREWLRKAYWEWNLNETIDEVLDLSNYLAVTKRDSVRHRFSTRFVVPISVQLPDWFTSPFIARLNQFTEMIFQDDGFYADDASIIKDGIGEFVRRVVLTRYTTLRSNRSKDKNRLAGMEKEVQKLYTSKSMNSIFA